MTSITGNAVRQLRERIGRLSGPYDATIPAAVTRALSSILAAKNYDDPILKQAAITETLNALQEAVSAATKNRQGLPAFARTMWRNVSATIANHPYELGSELDDIGHELKTLLDSWTAILVDLRDGPVRLLDQHGYPIAEARQLERDIAELGLIKSEILDNWPWSHQELPPLNREMLAASMEALRRGETGEPIEDLIRRIGG